MRQAGREFGDDIQVTQVPGVLLHQVEQDTLQGGRVGAVPAIAGLAHYVSARGGRLIISCGPGAIRGLLVSTGLGPHLEDAT